MMTIHEVSRLAGIRVRMLQQCITDHFYPCTPEIPAGLGKMYTADERFRRNIDAAGDGGTAALAARAIRHCCGRCRAGLREPKKQTGRLRSAFLCPHRPAVPSMGQHPCYAVIITGQGGQFS